jgi:hypothetical protein
MSGKRISMSFSEAEVRYLHVLVRRSNPTGIRKELSRLLPKLARAAEKHLETAETVQDEAPSTRWVGNGIAVQGFDKEGDDD